MILRLRTRNECGRHVTTNHHQDDERSLVIIFGFSFFFTFLISILELVYYIISISLALIY
jgi:Co/Zn/Cd efflux system component